MADRVIRLMEVCGSHTMAIARAGIRGMLPPDIRLLSGPGCPVCVTAQETIDKALAMTEIPGLILTTYGDMVRVPGSVRGDNLAARRASGADVRVVYSPMDAVKTAAENPDKQVVFLGVGFETTAPGTASAIEAAADAGLGNFSVFSMLKLLEPSIRALAADPDFHIDGFICPGHVAVIIGEEGMRFFGELGFPGVITGFETADILKGIAMLIRQIRAGTAVLQNEYTSVVRPEGNPEARAEIEKVFEKRTDTWRGLGDIFASGLGIRSAYAAYDAERRFPVQPGGSRERPGCRCGDVIKGKLDPAECPLFGKRCTPQEPEGPCMVSSEGACAAAYRYGGSVPVL